MLTLYRPKRQGSKQTQRKPRSGAANRKMDILIGLSFQSAQLIIKLSFKILSKGTEISLKSLKHLQTCVADCRQSETDSFALVAQSQPPVKISVSYSHL